MARPYRDTLSWTRTLLLVAVAGLLVYCIFIAYSHTAEAGETHPSHLPSAKALMEVKGAEGTRITYDNFEVDFNPELHIPNFVAWELTANETQGTEKRSNFATDPDV